MTPIRKRGFHRALKRGEPWAVAKNNFNDLLKDLDNSFWCDYENGANLFLELSKRLPEEPNIVPIEYFGVKRK